MNKTKETSIEKIRAAIISIEAKGIKPTQKEVSIETGLSIVTVKRNWKDRVSVIDNRVSSTEPNRVSRQVNRVSDSFDRLKRRAGISTMGISYCNPAEF